jgi:hypothetical protein
VAAPLEADGEFTDPDEASPMSWFGLPHPYNKNTINTATPASGILLTPSIFTTLSILSVITILNVIQLIIIHHKDPNHL